MFLISCSAFSETLVLNDGSSISGRLGDLQADIIKFYGDSYVTYPLGRIRSIEVDEAVDEAERIKQENNIARLQKVIDSEFYLISDLEKKTLTMLLNKEYKALDALAKKMRDEEQRFPSGRLKEAVFYYGFDSDLSRRSTVNYQPRIELINNWIATTKSETAKIAFMQVSIGYAWAHRGRGYSNTLSQKGSENFTKILSEAIDVGEELRQRGSKNLSVFAKLIAMYKTRTNNNDYIRKLAIEAARINPHYYGLHNASIVALLPKWGGSRDEVKTYMRRVAEKYGRKENQDLYFRLATFLFDVEKNNDFIKYQLNWPRIKKSFIVYEKNYPVTEYHYHNMAYMAGLFGDRDATTQYLSATTKQWNHFAKAVWARKKTYDTFVEWSNKTPTPEFSTLLMNFLSANLPLDYKDQLKLYSLSGGNIDEEDALGDTLLHHAVDSRNRPLAALLISLGANPEKQNRYGYMALHIATRFNNRHMVETLLAEGSDVNAKTSVGWAVTHVAAKRGFTGLIAKFVDMKPNLLNAKSDANKTPLHLASSYGHVDAVDYLLAIPSVMIDVQDSSGYTPLHYAVQNNHLDILKKLIAAGSDAALSSTKYNYTPLNLARQYKAQSIVDYLVSINAPENTPVISFADIDKAKDFYDQAGPYYSRGEYNESISWLKKAIQLNPVYARAHHFLAMNYLYLVKDYTAAEKYILRAIELDSKDTESYYTAGRVYYALGKMEESKPFFIEYVSRAPESYNTQDLKKNYKHLLINTTTLAAVTSPSIASPSSLSSEGLFYFDKYRLPIIGIFLLFLFVFLVIRRRNISD